MSETVMALAMSDFESLGTVRTVDGILASTFEGKIWLRGIPLLEKADKRVRQLPAEKTYLMNEEQLLFPVGGATPEGKLPETNWKSIAEFVSVENPVSAMPGLIKGQSESYRVPFKLNRSELSKEGEALYINLEEWKAFADSTPLHRLQALKFAVSDQGEVLVMGTPLPAIPGKEYWMRDMMLIPGGYDLEYPALSAQISERLNPLKDAVIVLHEDGNWEKIGWDDFVSASRSAIRLTRENHSQQTEP
jgi:hypothetical protein